MTRLENLKSRVKALAPAAQPEVNPVSWMSDEEIDRRAREILGGNTDHLDPDLVRQARHIRDRRARS
ncbi:MAG TPA: hypothetical protein PKM50_08065 [Methanoregula sp.]|nr:hypothetical protein [Methanoregula sp.]